MTINSPSMEPLLTKGETVEVSKVPATLERGMVVMFKAPSGWLDQSDTTGKMVKRLVAVGGDRVDCDPTDASSGGRVVVNGEPLDESAYLPAGVAACDVPFRVQVPPGGLWLMGDNRPNSADSRAHLGDPGGGFVDQALVLGVIMK